MAANQIEPGSGFHHRAGMDRHEALRPAGAAVVERAVQVRAVQARVAEVRPAKVGAAEVDAAKVGAAEVRARQIREVQVRAVEVRAGERRVAEVRVGKARREALRDIVQRTEVQPLTNFISAIIQAEQLGVSISKVLQVQSEQLRIERRQRAEEMAAKAPIKMLFPLVGCIFPSLFIVILGPAIILIMQNLNTGS